ncbi:hypothetical protein B0H21DRAFT_34585 [Amylocystis lapponica]|nr:hypothetical protein B0H21DRAFT_34585 [Amylocystis lapponica]
MASDHSCDCSQKRADGGMVEAQIIANDSSTAMVTTSPRVEHLGPILPPEITDQIIDNLRGCQHALCQCALTCRAWRPRSQLCLVHDVVIRSRAALKAFGAHLRDGRCLPYMHSVYLDQNNNHELKAGDQFVHLVPLVLPQVLESIKQLRISRIHWDKFPPHLSFPFLPTQFPHLVSLTLHKCHFSSLKEVFTVLSAFPSISCLRLSSIRCTNISTRPVLSAHHKMRARLRELCLSYLVGGTANSTLECLIHYSCLETLRDLRLDIVDSKDSIDKATMEKLGQMVGPSLESLRSNYLLGPGGELLTACTRLHSLSLGANIEGNTATPDMLVDYWQLSSVVRHNLRKLYINMSTGDSKAEEMLPQWHRLDDVLMHERFPLLTAVVLQWRVGWGNYFDPEEAAWAEKFLEQFPNLRQRGIVEVVPMPEVVASELIATTSKPEYVTEAREKARKYREVWLEFSSN